MFTFRNALAYTSQMSDFVSNHRDMFLTYGILTADKLYNINFC